MQKAWTIGWATLVLVSVGMMAHAGGHYAGGGVRYDLATSDTDFGYGLYGTYLYDISPLFSVQAGAGYLQGDFDLTDAVERDGSYTAWTLDLALVARFPNETLVPYAGMGAEMNYLDFDDMNVSDKLSMFYTGGLRIPVGDRLDIDANLRYRHLQPKSYNPFLEEIRMDGFVFRVGILWEL